ncbi:MAG TPA: hypothetical protein VNH46_03635, partial [Gemmatimonadales bacterium]|nr:hypothetical protein [Gemmatimonadales bacterium]
LNGPKGLAIQGDTLWVADIDAVRGFNRRTGAVVASIELDGRARFLNDIVAAPDGSLYVTDTGLALENGQLSHPGPDRVFRIQGRQASIAAEGPWLAGPNGITFDPAGARFIIVPFNGKELLGWHPGSTTVDTVGTGPGGQDGVEFLKGRLLASSWADSTVFAVDPNGVEPVVRGVPSPADIGVDPARNWLAVPIFQGDRVEFWHLP